MSFPVFNNSTLESECADMESLFETRVFVLDFYDQPSRERARDGNSNPRLCTRAAASSARPLAILLIKYCTVLTSFSKAYSSVLEPTVTHSRRH